MIAALGDLHVGEMFRREPEARRAEIRNVVRADVDLDHQDFLIVRRPGADECIHVGEVGLWVQFDQRSVAVAGCLRTRDGNHERCQEAGCLEGSLE